MCWFCSRSSCTAAEELPDHPWGARWVETRTLGLLAQDWSIAPARAAEQLGQYAVEAAQRETRPQTAQHPGPDVIPVGAHVPSINPLDEAQERQADIAQIFLSNPQSWKKPPPRQDAAALRDSPIPIYVHAPYLINVCADNNRVRIPSRRILQDTCDAAAEVGALAVIVHGGHVTGDGPQEEGIDRWRKALDTVDTEIPILIENTAGGDKAVARRVEWIARLFDEIGEFGVGFVLDTCHCGQVGSRCTRLFPASWRRRGESISSRSTTRRTRSTHDGTATRIWAKG